MTRRSSSKQWLKAHAQDPYVRQARAQGYRSRAVFKLEEIQQRERILHCGSVVVDLGAAPGGWSQYATEWVGAEGKVVALDVLPMDAIPGVAVIEGDFEADETLERLRDLLGGRPVDLVMSDMAPNISGVDSIDQPRSMGLVEMAWAFAREQLKPGGGLLTKAFQGKGFDELTRELRGGFDKVKTVKPKASRSGSREVYLLARGFKLV